MEVRRIGPDGGFLREFSDYRDRIKSLETRPAGNIVIRETLKTADPTTGVETILGELPDGSYGIQPFVGDTEPPPVATTPSASAQPGVIVVSWDGQFVASAEQPKDFVHVNVWGHKFVSGVETSSQKVGLIRLSTESLFVTTDVIAIGETWKFSLESEDYNGNLAAKGAKSSLITMSSNLDSGVTQAIIDSANGMNAVYYQPTMPTGGVYHTNDLWYDTDDGYTLYVYSGGSWTVSRIGHQAISTLDAGKISVGLLDGVFVKAKTVTTDKLVITSTDNLILEANFNNGGFSWDLGANNSINATAGRGSLPAMRFTGTTSAVSSTNKLNKISVGAEFRFRAGIWAKSSAALPAGSVKLKARAYTDATTYSTITVASNDSAFVSGTWKNISGISGSLPSGTIAIEFLLEVTNDATGTTTDVDYVSVTRASDASLIVDGAIDGKVITGATLQTASSGARIVLDSTSLNAYDSSSNNYFSVSNSGGVSIAGKGSNTSRTRTNYAGWDCSFEVDNGSWTANGSSTLARDTAQAYIGTHSGKLTNASNGDRSAYVKCDIGALVPSTFSVYVRHDSASSRNFRIDYAFYDGTFTQIGSTTTGSSTGVSANAWTRLTVTTSIPPSTAYRVYFTVVGIGVLSSENIWFDAVMMENSGTATTFFDGYTAPSGGYTYTNLVTSDLPASAESITKNVTIKAGANAMWNPGNLSQALPGVGFVLDTPLAQTAGIFSDGNSLSLIEGNGGGAGGSRIDIGDQNGQHITMYGWNGLAITGRSSVVMTSQVGQLQLNGNGGSGVAISTNGGGGLITANGREIGYASYVEFTNSQTGVPNATVWGVGTPTAHARSTNTSMVSATGGDSLTFNVSGIYSIAFTLHITNTPTGRTFCSMSMSYDTYPIARNEMAAGDDTVTATATVRVNSGETVTFPYYQTSGGSTTAASRIRIARISDI